MTLYVSDHAVLRFLERVYGIDVEKYRAELAALAVPGHERGMVYCEVDGLVISLRGDHVTSVRRSGEDGQA